MSFTQLRDKGLGCGSLPLWWYDKGCRIIRGQRLLGRIENAHKRLSKKASQASLATVLRNMANYLEQPCSNLLHPEGFRQLYKRFSRLDKGTQLDILLKLGINRELIQACNNSLDRTKLYKSYLKNENNIN